MKRKYSDEEKQKIIDRYISGKESSVNIIADTGVPKSTFYSVIRDLYARLVIEYKIGNKNSTQLVKSTFLQAYSKRQPLSDLLYHTDRGFNYASKTMAEYLKSLDVTHSFSRPYVPYDNSVIESFFSSLKREELYRTKYKSEKDFRDAVDKYIVFYNTKRPHRKLQYKTPEQKEQEYALKQEVVWK